MFAFTGILCCVCRPLFSVFVVTSFAFGCAIYLLLIHHPRPAANDVFTESSFSSAEATLYSMLNAALGVHDFFFFSSSSSSSVSIEIALVLFVIYVLIVSVVFFCFIIARMTVRSFNMMMTMTMLCMALMTFILLCISGHLFGVPKHRDFQMGFRLCNKMNYIIMMTCFCNADYA